MAKTYTSVSGHRERSSGGVTRAAVAGSIAHPAAPRNAAFALALQRSAGNRAVTTWLRTPVSVPAKVAAVQRYESYEHAGAGDKAAGSSTFDIQGISVSSGEINALADLYGTLDDIKKADPAELQRVVDLIRKQRADPSSVSEADWDKATNGRYTRLNLANSPHFAPSRKPTAPGGGGGPADGPDNRAVWRTYYGKALAQAHYARGLLDYAEKTPDTLLQNQSQAEAELAKQEARLQNAFGEHYLMDAFSAGHLFSKDDALTAISDKLGAVPPKDLKALFAAVATNVWATSKATIEQYQGPYALMWFDLNSAGRFQAVLEGIYDDPDGKAALKSAIVKYAHDKLNVDGVEVKNAFATWRLAGDKTLATSADTQHWINEAVEKGRSGIETVATTYVAGPDDQIMAGIEQYLPEPTAAAQKIIDDLVASVTDPKDKMTDAISAVAGREIEALLEGIAARGKIRKKP